MQFKEGLGWMACYDEATGRGGAELMHQGSWDLYEISAAVFNSLTKGSRDADAEELIRTGRHLYMHVNDRCGPPYTVVLDDDYAAYCPWMADSKPAGKVWDDELTDAAVALFESEKPNREQRRRKRSRRRKKQ